MVFKVVLADDESWIRSLIRSIVAWRKLGAEVVGEAESGGEALSLCRIKGAQILLTDVKMPGMNGLELIARVRSEFPIVQCMIVSGYDQFDFVQKALRLGVLDYVLKPIEKEQVEGVLRQGIERLEEIERQTKERMDLRQRVKRLEIMLTGNDNAGQRPQVGDWRIERSLRYLETNLSSHPSLRQVADACCMSPSYFSEKFKETLGIGFSQYLAELRVRHAALLIDRRQLKIREIAEMLGFTSQNYFSRFFKKAFGCSPEEFRHERGNIPSENGSWPPIPNKVL
jgi:YesN/AraC family two-component response regulator